MKGLRVLNTRPLNQSGALDRAIRDGGGISINLPALTITATALDWLSQMPELATISQAVFISANAVDYYYSALKQAHISWPANIVVTAVGHATAAALSRQGVNVDFVPSIADSEHLLALDSLQKIQHQNILLIKGLDGRPLIAETLQSRGACLIPLAVYRRGLPDIKQEYINSIWQDDAVDIILFTSQQAMHNLFTLFSEEGRSWLRSKPCLVISTRLAEASASLGIQTIITCQHDKILDALYHYHYKE